jgi:hypothetical protein
VTRPPQHRCVESLDPRRRGQCSCGRPIIRGLRERDIRLERELTATAAASVGLTDMGLSDFADARALPGGVRADIDPDREAMEEYADARNYLVWGIEPIYAQVGALDSRFTDDYERRMRSLRHLVQAWTALRTPSA